MAGLGPPEQPGRVHRLGPLLSATALFVALLVSALTPSGRAQQEPKPSARKHTEQSAGLSQFQRPVRSLRHPVSKLQRSAPEKTEDATLKSLQLQEASRKEAPSKASKPETQLYNITLHGNAVLTGTIRIYLIYYGNWSGSSASIENFVGSLSREFSTPKGRNVNRASDWWRIVRAYSNMRGQKVGKAVFGGRYFDSYSQGKDLTNKVNAVVYSALQQKKLPVDANGAYMVLTSADVLETPKDGFCAGTYPFVGNPVGYCGWHYYFHEQSMGNIAYAFVGNANQCVKRCGHLEGFKSTPNGDVGIDAMVNVLAHELAEAATNWDGRTGWYDQAGYENADKCNRLWGTMKVAKKKAYGYNMVGQGGMRWLVQLMWDLPTQSCRMKR